MNDISFAGVTNSKDYEKERVCGDHELLFFESAGTLECDGALSELSQGDVAVIPPLFKYRINCLSAVRVVLDKALLPVKSVTVIKAEFAEELRYAISNVLSRFTGKKTETEGVLSAYGSLLAALVAAYSAPDGYSPVVKAVLEDEEKHLGDSTYSLESFIRSLPLNYDYVRKLFKKEVGVTPHEYLTRARMQRAKAILLSGVTNRYSNYSVTQIAEACGYSEPLYFSRVFKQYYGVAPSHYLKNL
ncbi:MAG: helix-turn-helix transcriptional regulator [Clostridia bacterium]|nr:helix-turn-helix transcriptional regulator [Clostridia bacterium]